MKQIKAIIIDDEQQIREGLKILLLETVINVIGEASNITEAKTVVENLKPELVFLDIQLHNKTGFDMLESLTYLNFKLIFITAYNEYALKAFKYNAFDYLLKPIDPDELYNTLNRLQKQETIDRTQLQLLKTNSNLDRVVIKTTQNIYTIPLSDIIRCEADQGYTHFYLKNNKHILSSKTLKEYNSIFPEAQFIRVHQSHLINWQYVDAYDKKGFLSLKNEESIPVSVRKRSTVLKLLSK